MSVPPEQRSQDRTVLFEQTQETVLRSASLEETQRWGELLGGLLASGDLILLQGDLGTGKTALTQGIGRGLGVQGTINSPTFTILKEYEGRLPLYHFDLYRIEDPDELPFLGFDEYFGGAGVSVVEWAERAEATEETGTSEPAFDPWPANYLRVQLRRVSNDERSLTCTARGERGNELLAAFAQAAATAMNEVA